MIKILLKYSAIIFVALNVIQALFIPSHVRFFWDEVFLIPAMVYSFLYVFRFKELKILWGILLSLSGVLLVSSFLQGIGISSAILGYSFRWIKYAAIFSVVFISCKEKNDWKHWIKLFHLFFIVYSGINLFVLVGGYWGNALQYYFDGKQAVFISNNYEFGSFRLSGTQLSPNSNALLIGFFGLFFFILNKKKYWKSILLAFILVLLTQSRTIALAFPVSCVIVLFFQIKRIRFSTKALVYFLGGIAIFFVFTLLNKNLYSLLNLRAFESRSFRMRIDNLKVLDKLNGSELLIGKGKVANPVEEIGIHFDSEYIALLFQYGIIGLLLWLGIHIFYIYFGRKNGFKWQFVGFLSFVALNAFTNTSLLYSNFSILFFLALGVLLSGKIEQESR